MSEQPKTPSAAATAKPTEEPKKTTETAASEPHPPHVLDLKGVEWGLNKGGMASGPVGAATVAKADSDFGIGKGGQASGPVCEETVAE